MDGPIRNPTCRLHWLDSNSNSNMHTADSLPKHSTRNPHWSTEVVSNTSGSLYLHNVEVLDLACVGVAAVPVGLFQTLIVWNEEFQQKSSGSRWLQRLTWHWYLDQFHRCYSPCCQWTAYRCACSSLELQSRWRWRCCTSSRCCCGSSVTLHQGRQDRIHRNSCRCYGESNWLIPWSDAKARSKGYLWILHHLVNNLQ